MPGVEPGTIAQQHPGRTTTSQLRCDKLELGGVVTDMYEAAHIIL